MATTPEEEDKKKTAAPATSQGYAEEYKQKLNESAQATKTAADEYNTANAAVHQETQAALGRVKDMYDDRANRPTDTTEVDDAEQKQKDYLDQLAKKNAPLTPEQEEKERKRRRNAAIWSAVGDGIAAIASLGSTMNYGKPFGADKTLSERQMERWKELDADRKDKDNMYYNVLTKYGDLARGRYERKEKADKDRFDAQIEGAKVDVNIAQDKGKEAGEKFTVAQAVQKAEDAAAGAAYKVGENQETVKQRERQIAATRAAGRAGGSGGSRGSGGSGNSGGNVFTYRIKGASGNKYDDMAFHYNDNETGVITAQMQKMLYNKDVEGKYGRTIKNALATNDAKKIATAFSRISSEYPQYANQAATEILRSRGMLGPGESYFDVIGFDSQGRKISATGGGQSASDWDQYKEHSSASDFDQYKE